MIFKGDIGAKIIVAVGQNVATATVKKIYYRKPDGTAGSWTAALESNNTSISYTTTVATDLNLVGTWTLQAYIEMPGWTGYGEVTTELEVNENTSTEAITLTVGTNTWISMADAETYFRTRLGASAFWNNDADKPAALISAYRQLVNCDDYELPTAVADITEAMENAQCEMALFLIIHQADMDARMGLQAQGVTQAGIVQETYSGSGGIAIPAIVKNLLVTYEGGSPLFAANVERDDDEDA